MEPVILYSQPGCSSCTVAKQYLDSRGVSFVERDIRSDPEFLRELVEDLQSRTTPTLVIGDKVVMGFDPEKILAALNISG